MRVRSPFDHRPDPQVGHALREALSGKNEAAFIRRVIARASQVELGGTTAADWMEVLSVWARPGLVAASVVIVGGSVWLGGLLGSNESEPLLGDPLLSAGDTGVPTYFAAPLPPDADEVLSLVLENR